mmetsp:Transcript_108169/g.214824  ORF Transcript_108169/g.214824 Transcript_108169/m.214824 type:complete len:395 (+) Transcript_108169:80-1264(+)
MLRKVNVASVNGDAFEVAVRTDEVGGPVRGLHLRKAIQHKLDARGKVSIPIEMIALLHGDKLAADADQLDLLADSTLQFTITQFPHLNFDWMMFHMWENFLGAEGFCCPTSCEDYFIFYREPEAKHRIMTEQGATLYAVYEDNLPDTAPLRKQIGKELPVAELESSQLPPCRASVLPHLAHCAERLQLVDNENILVYTEAEWNIALYQETEIKGRSREDLFSRYPYQNVIEAFYSHMAWSSMEIHFPEIEDPGLLEYMKRHGIDIPEKNPDCNIADKIDKWLEEQPAPGNPDYEDHPSLKEKFQDLCAILRTFARGGNATVRKVAGDVMISKSAKVSQLAQQLAELKGCSVSDLTLLVNGQPLSDMSLPLLSLADSEDNEGRLNFHVSLIRKAS